ncbi:MAG: flagellar biosynthesis protein FlhA [Firmicutes bacterium]|nr:flagellar biosynthesis protein FlhA [Bacillota bacterium]
MINRLTSFQKLSQYSDIYVVFAVVLIVVMMIIPLPTFLLDILFACNISLALLVLLITMNVKEALDISVFPSLLLLLTLFRLALNISSTRLILLHGNAGKIVSAFGNFVAGGNIIVGFVIFFILVVIQFVVITKGAERVAEVAARFTLDAMPGKQMSIDADLNAGLISETEARQKRMVIQKEADFYGSMDGASKFVKGDAIAGIIITVINIIGGLAVGILQRGYDLKYALNHYTLLTIGDGLVSQIPALLISTATGILVTRAASDDNLGSDLTKQLFNSPKVLIVSGGVLLIFAIIPGLPFIPFFALGALFIGIGFLLLNAQHEADSKAVIQHRKAEMEEVKRPESILSLLQIDQIELEIGYSLIPLVDAEQGGDMLERISMIRRQCALELGMVVPIIRIRDNLQLAPNNYVIKIKGVQVGAGELMINQYLAMDSGQVTQKINGVSTKEPAFGLDAIWIDEQDREKAELAGYTVVDPPSILATHLTEIIKAHAHELLGRQEVQTLLNSMRDDYSAVIDELIPNLMNTGEIQKVLQNLLREQVSIRNLLTILETLADAAPIGKDIDYLTETVRQALARQICHQYLENDYISCLTLDQRWEEAIASGIEQTERGTLISLEPRLLQNLFAEIQNALQNNALIYPIILVSPSIRMALKRLTERIIPNLIVLSFNEIVTDVQVKTVGMVRWPNES